MTARHDLAFITDIDCKLKDNAKLIIGGGTNPTVETTGDVYLYWDATKFMVDPDANDSLLSWGDGSSCWDHKFYFTSNYLYFDSSAALVYTTGVDVQFKDNDVLVFGTGSGATGDVGIVWDENDLNIIPVADDTSVIFGNGTLNCDVRFLAAANDYWQFDASDVALECMGECRLDFTGATIAAANVDGGIIKGGASGARIVEDTASMKFVSFYFDDGATSGTAVGIYDRLYVTGAAGSGTALRAYTTVEDVAGATADGAQISLSFGATGTVTGQGTAVRATLQLPDKAGLTGYLSAVDAVVWSDGATTDPVGSRLAVYRATNAGNTTGGADVDTDAALVDFVGWTVSNGNLISAAGNEPTWGGKTHQIRCRLPDGTPVYLVAVVA